MYIARLTFEDKNSPLLRQECQNELQAIAQILYWVKTKAGIKIMDYFTPQGDKVCFDRDGNYFFTVTAETCKDLNLKP